MYMIEDKDEKEFCCGCQTVVIEPYIKCVECTHDTVLLCLHCFARGLEVDVHQNNHHYEVIKNDFTLLEKGWTAGEEEKLLAIISECGLGNWTDIASQLKTKTAKQCEQHYNKCFVHNPCLPLPVLPEREIRIHPTPFIYRACEDPPRPTDNSTLQQDMSGYMAARGDFTVEHKQYAELDLKNIEFNNCDTQLEKDIKLAVLDVYRNILIERERKKDTIKRFGLINLRKHGLVERKYYNSLGYQRVDRLRSIMKVLPPMAWDMYLESVHYEFELRTRIKELQEYRSQGIVNEISANVYQCLKSRRCELLSKKSIFEDVCNNIKDDSICRQWLNKQNKLGIAQNLPNIARRSAPPLDIAGLPGYDKLTDEERELCATSRIIPESYLQYKSLLINEQCKSGHVKLRVARSLIKIDVNKTRKVYDFLCKEGYICKNM